jgi:hypothetical protein
MQYFLLTSIHLTPPYSYKDTTSAAHCQAQLCYHFSVSSQPPKLCSSPPQPPDHNAEVNSTHVAIHQLPS